MNILKPCKLHVMCTCIISFQNDFHDFKMKTKIIFSRKFEKYHTKTVLSVSKYNVLHVRYMTVF